MAEKLTSELNGCFFSISVANDEATLNARCLRRPYSNYVFMNCFCLINSLIYVLWIICPTVNMIGKQNQLQKVVFHVALSDKKQKLMR